MWLDLAIATSCGGGGVVCGWIMHALGGFGDHTLVQQARTASSVPESGQEPSAERVSEVAARLKAYASTMEADVDAHQTTVQAVNNSLLEDNESSSEVVLAAVSQLIEANEKMQAQLRQAQNRIHEQTAQIETAERRAQTDALTRVLNRGAFDLHLQKRHQLGPGKAGTLALMDVDHFKKFNDIYGHRAGDEVLKVVAGILHARLQQHGLVARFGGEEFAVILDGCSAEKASQYLEEARRAIGERDILFENKRLRVNASMGLAELTQPETIEQWLQRADDALYHSKKAGRNCGYWTQGKNTLIKVELHDCPATSSQAASSAAPQGASAAVGQSSNAAVGQSSSAAGGQSSSARGDHPNSASSPARASDVPDELCQKVAPSGEKGQSAASRTAESDPSGDDGTSKPSAFAYLPDRETLGLEYGEIRGRTQDVSVFVMAIRCHHKALATTMRSMLQIVRASMRAVDRLGCEDESTILICMPSVNATTATQRGQQICRSANAVAVGRITNGTRAVTVGVAEAEPEEEFSAVVSRAVAAAQQCHQENRDCLCLESQGAAT